MTAPDFHALAASYQAAIARKDAADRQADLDYLAHVHTRALIAIDRDVRALGPESPDADALRARLREVERP